MSWQNVKNDQNTNRKDHSLATDKTVAIVQDEMSNMKENDILDLLVLDILVFRSFGFRPYVFRCSFFRHSVRHQLLIALCLLLTPCCSLLFVYN